MTPKELLKPIWLAGFIVKSRRPAIRSRRKALTWQARSVVFPYSVKPEPKECFNMSRRTHWTNYGPAGRYGQDAKQSGRYRFEIVQGRFNTVLCPGHEQCLRLSCQGVARMNADLGCTSTALCVGSLRRRRGQTRSTER